MKYRQSLVFSVSLMYWVCLFLGHPLKTTVFLLVSLPTPQNKGTRVQYAKTEASIYYILRGIHPVFLTSSGVEIFGQVLGSGPREAPPGGWVEAKT